MADEKVTVTIPVGPSEANQHWLFEAIESVQKQTYSVDEILLIDDMADLPQPELLSDAIRIWRTPWLVGIPTAFNFGVALARNELVFMLGSDDWLEPQCIEACVKGYRGFDKRDETLFFVGVKYNDGREDSTQFAPCNAAMVTKSLWKRCGGFPIESASGACDASLISIMMKNPEAGGYIGVGNRKPLYNYRVHPGTDTAQRQAWQSVILQTRDILTSIWQTPAWAKLQ